MRLGTILYSSHLPSIATPGHPTSPLPNTSQDPLHSALMELALWAGWTFRLRANCTAPRSRTPLALLLCVLTAPCLHCSVSSLLRVPLLRVPLLRVLLRVPCSVAPCSVAPVLCPSALCPPALCPPALLHTEGSTVLCTPFPSLLSRNELTVFCTGTASYSDAIVCQGPQRCSGGLCTPWSPQDVHTQLWHVRSSLTRHQTLIPCIARRIPNPWTTREVSRNTT